MTAPAHVTVVTAETPRVLSKTFTLGEDGKLVKGTSAQMTKGRAEVRKVSNLEDFADLLSGLSTSQALTYGVPPSDKVGIVTRRAWLEAGQPTDLCTRTNEHFMFRHGTGFMFLDYDPQPGIRPLPRDELIQAAASALPSLFDAGCVWLPSSSSHIHNTDTDLTGLKGQRLYLLVADASDIPRAGNALEARLWLAGHGRYEVSKSGALLPRCLFDVSVFQPSRLDFAAGADCTPPLHQKRGLPRVIQGTVAVLDTRKALPDLKAREAKEFERIRSVARDRIKAKAAAVRATWLEARCVSEAGDENTEPKTRERIRRTLQRAAQTSTLHGDFALTVVCEDGTHTRLAIADLLGDRERFDGCRTLDPLEPDYRDGQDCGLLFLEPGNDHLFSYAHGGQRYALKADPTPDTISESGSPTPGDYGAEIHCKSMRNGSVVYYWRQADGAYVAMSGENVQSGLVVIGCSDRGKPSPVDTLLHTLRVEQNLAYAGRLAGWDAGIHTLEGKRFLSLASPQVPEAAPGAFPTIDALLSGMFPDEDNRRRFVAWVFHAWDMLSRRVYRELPALALVGPRGCGKTLFVHLIRWILGNYEMGKAYCFLKGATTFNAELAESVLLVVDDEAASSDMRARRALGQAVKAVATCQPPRIEGKNIDAVTLRPHWRVVICTNNEPEHVTVLPVIDESTADKILVLSCQASPMPMDTQGDERKERFMSVLKAEVPGWLHSVGQAVGRWGLADGRFMVTGWQDPAILELLQAHTDEERLMELIDLAESTVFDVTGVWEGSSTELQATLCEATATRHVAGKLLTWPRACGQYLERLGRRYPDRIRRTGPVRSRHWQICRAGQSLPATQATAETVLTDEQVGDFANNVPF